ncbi:hypothetical protein L208DRAFT_1145789, partial [Tricholoma matsutake]
LSNCICGDPVSQEDIQAGRYVIQCKQQGCKTQWYHLPCVRLDYPNHSWTCEVCEA